MNVSDDFSGTAVDKTHWSVYDNPTAALAHSAKNVVVQNSVLTLKTAYDAALGKYTTAGLCLCPQKGSLAQTYGEWQVRAKTSAGDSRALMMPPGPRVTRFTAVGRNGPSSGSVAGPSYGYTVTQQDAAGVSTSGTWSTVQCAACSGGGERQPSDRAGERRRDRPAAPRRRRGAVPHEGSA